MVGPNFRSPGGIRSGSWFSSRPAPPRPERSVPVAEPIDPNWWTLFHDPKLTALERQVSASNLDVQTAAARVQESLAELGITGAGLYPTFNANGSYERQKASNLGLFGLIGSGASSSVSGAPTANGANGALGNATGGVKTPNLPPFDLFQYGFGASWMPDLWGEVRRSIESSNASVLASDWARRGALLTALADVAGDYINLRGTQEQLRIARDNVRIAEQGLRLTQERATAGVTTDLDVANAAAQLRTTAAQIPSLEAQERQLINAIGLLLALPPNALSRELSEPEPVPPVPPRVPVGFPSDLARRRPDIEQAEAQLHAATAEIGVAVAAFYPSVTLSGSFGFQSLIFGNLFNWGARQYAAGPGVTIPIFEGGQLHYTLRLRGAQQREAAINYERTVLTAWNDVDNALTAYNREQGRRDQLIQAVAQNRRALSLAQSRYTEGVADFLNVLTAEQNLLATQQQLATSTTNVSADLVSLYLALGGGWEPFEPRPHRGHQRQ
jgi:NodT family efflux transporter outer membrane factor (OMF) lipoprotein